MIGGARDRKLRPGLGTSGSGMRILCGPAGRLWAMWGPGQSRGTGEAEGAGGGTRASRRVCAPRPRGKEGGARPARSPGATPSPGGTGQWRVERMRGGLGGPGIPRGGGGPGPTAQARGAGRAPHPLHAGAAAAPHPGDARARRPLVPGPRGPEAQGSRRVPRALPLASPRTHLGHSTPGFVSSGPKLQVQGGGAAYDLEGSDLRAATFSPRRPDVT